ncbi:MAG: UDP-N-acetylglucosamine--N-acetylmuramyl-(pentapeptide) pyrophosphoryl-undecaprenol N-acetylglucosamine transferase [Elusimicrobiota bacterium]
MKIVIAGGGTGGHFYPGYVIAKKLDSQGDEVVFIVKKNDISIPRLKIDDIPFVEMDITAFPRSLNPFSYIRFMLKLIKSLLLSKRIIEDFEPDIVFGTGSYVAFPIIFLAWLKKIPIFIHESNSVFGIGNFLCGFFSKKIFLGLPIRNNIFAKKTELIGTPLRDFFNQQIDVNSIKEKFKIKDQIVITCFGGSQGSYNINNAIYYFALRNKTESKKNIALIHITGKNNYEDVKKRYEKAGILDENIILLDYYENMNEIYEISDLIISRSGASTISELIYKQKPAILIPLLSAAKNHQMENARILFEKDAALILKDDNKLPENLMKNIDFIISGNRLSVMKKGYSHINLPNPVKSAEAIISSIKTEVQKINQK